MSETMIETPGVETPVAKPAKAKKARKAKPKVKAKAKAKTVAKAETNGQMSDSRLKVLKAAGVPATLDKLTAKTKMGRRLAYHHLWHLRQDGFVKSYTEDDDGVGVLMFEQTAKGAKTAKKA